MEQEIEKLKLLIQSGIRITALENGIGLPKNNLSAVLNGKKQMPQKWVEKIRVFLDNLEKPATSPYLNSEKEGQLIRIKSLGIPIDDGSTFEQIINTVIFLAGDYKGKYQELQKQSEGSPTGLDELSKLKRQIQQIKEEKIPDARNTTLGRPVWQKEQDNKIRALEYQILNKIP